jgi:hypothetical protein
MQRTGLSAVFEEPADGLGAEFGLSGLDGNGWSQLLETAVQLCEDGYSHPRRLNAQYSNRDTSTIASSARG